MGEKQANAFYKKRKERSAIVLHEQVGQGKQQLMAEEKKTKTTSTEQNSKRREREEM